MIIRKIVKRLKGILYSLPELGQFRSVGRNFQLLGRKNIKACNCSVGDNCWVQAVDSYKGQRFTPQITFGERVMMSNNVHISAVKSIALGNHVLLGSNIYIGDHSHGSTKPEKYNPAIPPALRPLDDIDEIEIGDNVWVCDGAIILAGSRIGSGSIVAAQALVKGIFPANCLIAGNPAKIIKRLV